MTAGPDVAATAGHKDGNVADDGDAAVACCVVDRLPLAADQQLGGDAGPNARLEGLAGLGEGAGIPGGEGCWKVLPAVGVVLGAKDFVQRVIGGPGVGGGEVVHRLGVFLGEAMGCTIDQRGVPVVECIAIDPVGTMGNFAELPRPEQTGLDQTVEADEVGAQGKRARAVVGRQARPRRLQRQDLPERAAGATHEVEKAKGIVAELTAGASARQARGVQKNTCASHGGVRV